MKEVKRRHSRNGVVVSETLYSDGVPHGMQRFWHENGVLAKEIPIEEGSVNGTVKQWSQSGKLLGSYDMSFGTGVEYTWHENGKLWTTRSFVNGERCGPARMYSEDGDLFAESYWLYGERVTWRVYHEKSKTDSRLPNSKDDSPKLPARIEEMKAWEKKLGPAGTADMLPKRLLQGDKVREALSWLEESKLRSLGETTSRREALGFVRRLYDYGAINVHAVEINGTEEEQNTGKLIVELPADKDGRKAVFEIAGKVAREQGYDPEQDVGQQYCFLMLD